MPLDILGIFFLILSLLRFYIEKKNKIMFFPIISFFGWIIGTLIWRFLIFQNPQILEDNLYGHPIVLIIFGISAVLFFLGGFLLLKIILSSTNFESFFLKKRNYAKVYLQLSLLYLFLHLGFSFGIIIGGFSSFLIVILKIALFFKIIVVPIFGILFYGGAIYILTKN
jgi:hypothetical protein